MSNQAPVPSIMDSLRRIVRVLRTASRTSQSDLGLRAGQLFVLQQLQEFQPLSLNELAERTFAHQSTVSVVIDGLVKQGLVHRGPSPKDRRFLVLGTTAKATKLLKRRRPTVQEKMADALEKMTAKDRKELARLLGEFTAQAGISHETPHFFFEKEPRSR